MNLQANQNAFNLPFRSRLFMVILSFLAALAWPSLAAAQVEAKSDSVTIFAAGRVEFCVSDHDILVGAIAGAKIPGAHAPEIVPMGPTYVGVLLGAVEWDTPNSNTKPVRLDATLPQTAAAAARRNPHPSPDDPSDIEKIGVATLELIRPQLEKIHDKLKLAPNQPAFELLLADYAYNYGPEIWELDYRVTQESLGNDYWDTRPMRPAYHQLYPPEKGHPHTLVEVNYPPAADPGLLDLLARRDPILDPVALKSPEAVAAIQNGDTQKKSAMPLADFLREAMPAAFGGKNAFSMALLEDRRGFQWLIAPPEPPPPPDASKPVEPGAPTLRKYTPPQ